MWFRSSEGRELFYEMSGQGPAVIFSHGFLMDHTMFDPQVEALEGEFRCIRWDQRGFGASCASPGPYTMWDSAEDCIALMDHLEVDAATLVGMSQGGYVTLRAALRYPQRVKALVLIDSRA